MIGVDTVREFYRESFRPNDPELTVKEVLDFVDYCLDFYGPGGINDYGFHFSEVCEGLIKRFQYSPSVDFDGDTVDRELVRDMVLSAREEENV